MGPKCPTTPEPGGKKGVGTGRERKTRTAKQPALEIHTRSADKWCTRCWILEKWKSKTYGQVPATGTTETKEKRVLFASLKETGTPQLDEVVPAHLGSSWESQGTLGALNPREAAQL